MAFKEKSLKGRVAISRSQSSSGEFINLRIEDEASSICFASLKMTLEQFAQAVTGLMVCDVDLTCYGLSQVGKKRISRTEIVEFSGRNHSLTDEEKLEFCKPVMRTLKKETGLKWKPFINDLGNYNKAVKGEPGFFYVTFITYEKKDEA